jgi:hypothetical protein
MLGWGGDGASLFSALVAVAGIGFLVLVLRWASKRGQSVVAAPARRGSADDYGLMVAAAAPGSYAEGEIARRTLEDAGVRANLAMTNDGPRVMVWPDDLDRATQLLAGR